MPLPIVALFGISMCLLVSNPRLNEAAVPSANLSDVDDVIVGDVVGQAIASANGPACVLSAPGFGVKVVDLAGNPIPGANVVLDFSASTVGLFQSQNTGTTVDCTLKTLSRISAINGVATFAPRFGHYDNSANVSVYADGVLLKRVPARSIDIDGIDGAVGLPDFRLFSVNFLNFSPDQSTNFDNCAPGGVATGLPDFATFSNGFTIVGVGVYCPFP